MMISSWNPFGERFRREGSRRERQSKTGSPSRRIPLNKSCSQREARRPALGGGGGAGSEATVTGGQY